MGLKTVASATSSTTGALAASWFASRRGALCSRRRRAGRRPWCASRAPAARRVVTPAGRRRPAPTGCSLTVLSERPRDWARLVVERGTSSDSRIRARDRPRRSGQAGGRPAAGLLPHPARPACAVRHDGRHALAGVERDPRPAEHRRHEPDALPARLQRQQPLAEADPEPAPSKLRPRFSSGIVAASPPVASADGGARCRRAGSRRSGPRAVRGRVAHQPCIASAVRSRYSCGCMWAASDSGARHGAAARDRPRPRQGRCRGPPRAARAGVRQDVRKAAAPRRRGARPRRLASVSRCPRSKSGRFGTNRRSRWWRRWWRGKTSVWMLAVVSHTASVVNRTWARSTTSTSISITRDSVRREIAGQKIRPPPKGSFPGR